MQNYTDAALLDLVGLALDRAVESLQLQGERFAPFVIVETAQGRSLHRFVAEPYEVGVSEARRFVAVPPRDAQRVLICYDGFLSLEGHRTDAVLIEAQDCRRPYSATFALRYRPASDEGPIELIGDPMFTGPAEPLSQPRPDGDPKPPGAGLIGGLSRRLRGRRS